jgi:hypothetical protein
MAIGEVTTGELTEWFSEIDRLDKPALTAKIKAVLSAMFQAAAEVGPREVSHHQAHTGEPWRRVPHR